VKWILYIIILTLIFSVAGCSEKFVRIMPYEKEAFSNDKMLFSPIESRSEFNDHIYSIREATQGGTSSLQGGCGCR